MSQQDGEAPKPGLITGAVTNIEKMAQGGRGLQTTTFDLGINSGNVDNELRQQSGGSGASRSGSSSSYSSGYSSGGSGGASNSSRSSSSQYHRTSSSGGQSGGSLGYDNSGGFGSYRQTISNTQGGAGNEDDGYGYEYDDYGDEGGYESESQGNLDAVKGSGHSSAYSSQSSYSRNYDSRNGDQVEAKFKHYPRTRREVNEIEDEQLQNALKCKSTKCAVLRCTAGPLESGNGALIALRTRLVAQTLHEVSYSRFCS